MSGPAERLARLVAENLNFPMTYITAIAVRFSLRWPYAELYYDNETT